ncbi:SPOR domain-containing protein [Legionella maioricensis]|uniref:SPOR domain-containing protein n=1 Tax=Legionella maioricensis TaxID=2896528 RepID=A0A9X2D0V0_9GAMM|nr:SPOR domain-containing protein [Legionella maioricensis]MCL9684429.1 SPOR domain-containing protein [Legionella maioricensis]MCL9687610.1 SPOR domain-containing protein [Legionella maioricensis]
MKEGKVQLDVTAANQSRTLFKPGSWLTKIDFINHLILFNNVLITVLSEKEGGKTSFNTLLQNNLDPQIKSISMTVKPPCDRETVINDIATQLHLNHDAQTNMTSIVTQVNERKAHVLLVIDDAQHLPESLIKEAMLAIKNQDNFGFFHLCLVSDYSVVATLNSLATDQFNNLIHTIELGSLNESEMRTYVLQRAMAAHLINKPLTDAQLKQFYQLTKGNVAKINSNLETFIFKCSSQKKNNKTFILKRASLAIAATVAVGISYFYFNGNSSTDFFKTSAPLDKVSEQVSLPPQQLISYVASWQDSSTRQLVHYALPKKQILDGMEDEEENINTVAIVDKVVVIPTVKTRTLPNEPNAPVTQEVLESKLVALTEHGQVVKKPVTKLNTKGYTIQLVASHRISDVHQFRKNNNLMNTTIRQFTNAKGTWYILTLGEYDSRNKAQLSAKKLPSKLAKLNPWVRPVSGLSNVG